MDNNSLEKNTQTEQAETTCIKTDDVGVSAEAAAAVSEQDALQETAVTDVTENTEENAVEITEKSEVETDEACSDESGVAPDREPTAANNTIYRWDYDMQRAFDNTKMQKKKRSGLLTYAIVMTAFFAFSFLVLLLSLLTGGLTGKDPEMQSGGNSTPSASNRIVYVREDDGESGYLTLQEIYAQSVDAIVAVSTQKVNGSGVGTGFVLRENGYIATNYHVVENADKIVVRLFDGKQYAAELINYSEVDDLAVIKIEASGLPVLPIGTSGDVLVGDDVVIIGHPAGLEFGWSTTGGIISAINREVKIKNPDGTLNKKMTLLQTNANVNSGNSGGPMMNLKGEVIGIITMKLSDGYEGMGFAIPIDGAMEILDAIIERGSADGVDSSVSKGRAVLGVTGFDVVEGFYYYIEGDRIRILSENELDQYEGEFYVNVSGFYLSGISEKSKCYGILQPGDIIFAIDGTATDSRTKMMAILDEKNVGDEAVIEYDRNGEVFSVKITMIAEE